MAETVKEYLELVKNAFNLSGNTEASGEDDPEAFPIILSSFMFNEWKKYHDNLITDPNRKDEILTSYCNFTLTSGDVTISNPSYDVIKINDKFIKFETEEDSWFDNEIWSDTYFVEPKERIVIDYIKIGE